MKTGTLFIVTVVLIGVTFSTVYCGKIHCKTLAEERPGKYDKCDMNYEKIGCYRDKENDRALPCELLNERDPINKNFDGHRIHWKDFTTYIQGLACRCAARAREKGHEIFGLQFYGECWSGDGDYKKHGEADKEKCLPKYFKHCNDKDQAVCVGKQYTNYVYRLKYTNACGLNLKKP